MYMHPTPNFLITFQFLPHNFSATKFILKISLHSPYILNHLVEFIINSLSDISPDYYKRSKYLFLSHEYE